MLRYQGEYFFRVREILANKNWDAGDFFHRLVGGILAVSGGFSCCRGLFSWLVGGGSHCSPGEFLTVFSLLTCPGELDVSGGNSGRRQDLFGGGFFQ